MKLIATRTATRNPSARSGLDVLEQLRVVVRIASAHSAHRERSTGIPGAQQLRISLAEDAAMAKPVDIGLPIGVGVQPTPELYLQLDTKLVQLDISDSANALIGKDMTPLALTVIYNVINALDVQAAIGTDLTNSPGDALTFLVGARYYAGQL